MDKTGLVYTDASHYIDDSMQTRDMSFTGHKTYPTILYYLCDTPLSTGITRRCILDQKFADHISINHNSISLIVRGCCKSRICNSSLLEVAKDTPYLVFAGMGTCC